MKYKVVPFVANISVDDNAATAAGQLADLINEEGERGWEHVRMENIEINIIDPGNDGCFGLGAVPSTQTTRRFDMVVFSQR